MIFESYSLPPTLSSYVHAVFYFRDFIPDHSVERVVPTGHLFLIFELDGFERHLYDSASLTPIANYQKVWIAGMHRNFLTISAHKHSEMMVVQFKTDGAFPFIHCDLSTLNEQVISADEILGQEILFLRDQLCTAQGHMVKFDLVEKYLLDRLNPDKRPPEQFRNLVSEMIDQPLKPLQEQVQEYAYTAQYLIKQFKKYVGLRPKDLLRILRFNQMLVQIQNCEKLVWTDIAYQNGYADQSHFIKEFKHFSGLNPQEFMEQDFPKKEVNFFPMDREPLQ